MIGHSSIYNADEFNMEWLKESFARENELLASKSKDKKTKRKHLRIARKTREQCLLYFAGQLFYDKEITSYGIIILVIFNPIKKLRIKWVYH